MMDGTTGRLVKETSIVDFDMGDIHPESQPIPSSPKRPNQAAANGFHNEKIDDNGFHNRRKEKMATHMLIDVQEQLRQIRENIDLANEPMLYVQQDVRVLGTLFKTLMEQMTTQYEEQREFNRLVSRKLDLVAGRDLNAALGAMHVHAEPASPTFAAAAASNHSFSRAISVDAIKLEPLSPKDTIGSIGSHAESPARVDRRSAAQGFRSRKFKSITMCASSLQAMVEDDHSRIEEGSLFDAIQNADVQQVSQLLEEGADPNERRDNIMTSGARAKQFKHCSALALASLGTSTSVVKALVQYKADPDLSSYSFVAGSLKMVWEGSAMYAAVPHANLDMLKCLIALSANPHQTSSTEANLVWQCCYFGHAEMLSYVLQLDVDCEVPAKSQDLKGVSHTPLHISSRNGHDICVYQLLKKHVDVNVQNELNLTPLDDAVIQCKASIVTLLVNAGSDLQSPKALREQDCVSAMSLTSAVEQQRESGWVFDHDQARTIDLIFSMSNPVIVAATAEGLNSNAGLDQMKHLKTDELVHFLMTPGRAPKQIMQALFRQRDVIFFKPDKKKNESEAQSSHRCHIVCAHVGKPQILPSGDRYDPLNVAVMMGCYDDIRKKMRCRQMLDDEEERFLNRLAPQHASKGALMVTVQLFEGLVADLHTDLKVIRAISKLDKDLFEQKACQAILQYCWKSSSKQAKLEAFTHAALMFDFLCIGILMRPPNPDAQARYLEWLTMGGAVIWMCNFATEVLQMGAFVKEGWWSDYVYSVQTVVDWGRICADGLVLNYLFKENLEALNNQMFLCVFALCAFYKWIMILYALTPFRTFGLSILPILHTMLDVGPFLTVLLFFVCGLMHGYIALSVPDIGMYDSALLVYQLGLLGDAAPDDLDGGHKKYWAAARIFYIVVAFMVTITLMNTYIAALGNSFAVASGKMEILYQSHLAERVLSYCAIRKSLRSVFCSRRDEGEKPRTSLWYCCAEKEEELGYGAKNYLGFA